MLPLGLLCECGDPSVWVIFFPRHVSGEQPGLEQVLVWDDSIVGGSFSMPQYQP